MTKKERQLRQKEARKEGSYSEEKVPVAVRFTTVNQAALKELSQKTGVSRNAIINAMVSEALTKEQWQGN